MVVMPLARHTQTSSSPNAGKQGFRGAVRMRARAEGRLGQGKEGQDSKQQAA